MSKETDTKRDELRTDTQKDLLLRPFRIRLKAGSEMLTDLRQKNKGQCDMIEALADDIELLKQQKGELEDELVKSKKACNEWEHCWEDERVKGVKLLKQKKEMQSDIETLAVYLADGESSNIVKMHTMSIRDRVLNKMENKID